MRRSPRNGAPFDFVKLTKMRRYFGIFTLLWLLEGLYYLSPLDGAVRRVPKLPAPGRVDLAAPVGGTRAALIVDDRFELWESKGGYARKAMRSLWGMGLQENLLRGRPKGAGAIYADGDKIVYILEFSRREDIFAAVVTLHAESLEVMRVQTLKIEHSVYGETQLFRVYGLGGTKSLLCGREPPAARSLGPIAHEPWEIVDGDRRIAKIDVDGLLGTAGCVSLVPLQGCRSELAGFEGVRLVLAADPPPGNDPSVSQLFLTDGERILDRWAINGAVDRIFAEVGFWWTKTHHFTSLGPNHDVVLALRHFGYGPAQETTRVHLRGWRMARPALGGSVILAHRVTAAAAVPVDAVVAAHAGRCAERERAAAAAAAAVVEEFAEAEAATAFARAEAAAALAGAEAAEVLAEAAEALAEAAEAASSAYRALPLIVLKAFILEDAKAQEWLRRVDGWGALPRRPQTGEDSEVKVEVMPD